MDDYTRKLIEVRLNAMPPNVGFSIGGYGNFSRDQLIQQVRSGTDVGKAAMRMELNYLKETAKISGKLAP